MYLQVLIDPASWLCLDEVHDVEQNGSTVRHIPSDEKMICSNLFLGIRRRSAHACPCVFTWMIIVNDETSLINLIATIIEASPLRYNAQKSKIDFCMYMLFLFWFNSLAHACSQHKFNPYIFHISQVHAFPSCILSCMILRCWKFKIINARRRTRKLAPTRDYCNTCDAFTCSQYHCNTCVTMHQIFALPRSFFCIIFDWEANLYAEKFGFEFSPTLEKRLSECNVWQTL